MYNQHFGLEKAPFKITPDTCMFYTGAGRGDVLDALVYSIVSGEGIIKVVGEVGTGKTMLCRMLELKLPENVEIVYLANPSLTPEDILHAIALEMSLDIESGINRIQVLHRIQQHLVEMHARNRHVVVLVEEAQSMPTSTLEEIRLLSNLETKQDKLLQIVLFGQPELDEKLSDPGIRQLRDRITHSFYLDPMDPEEVRDYVDFRLRGAGFRGRDAFRANAYEMMARASEGLTRRVNILADKALLAAFAEDTHDVTRKHVRIAANDTQFVRHRRWGWPEVAVAVGLVTIATAIGWAAFGDWSVQVARSPEPVAKAAPAAGFVSGVRAEVDAPPPGATPAVDEPAAASRAPATLEPAVAASAAAQRAMSPAPPETGSGVVAVSLADTARDERASVGTVETVALETAALETLALETVALGSGALGSGALGSGAPGSGTIEDVPVETVAMETGAADAVANEAVAIETVVETGVDAPAAASASRPEVVNAALAAPAERAASWPVDPTPRAAPARVAPAPLAPAPPPVAAMPLDGSLLELRLSATRDWLAVADGSHYSIQILVTDVSRRSSLEEFLRAQERANELDGFYVYRTDVNGASRYGVLYQVYRTFGEARAALERLPPELSRYRPFIRNVSDIAALG